MKTIKTNPKIKKCLKILPTRFHDEFINEVIIDEASIKSIKKVFEYYLAEILDELTQKEKDKIFIKIN
jgi:hypothetical protein